MSDVRDFFGIIKYQSVKLRSISTGAGKNFYHRNSKKNKIPLTSDVIPAQAMIITVITFDREASR